MYAHIEADSMWKGGGLTPRHGEQSCDAVHKLCDQTLNLVSQSKDMHGK